MRGAGQITSANVILLRKLEGDNPEDVGVEGRILEWILDKCGCVVWTRLIRFRLGTTVGCCKGDDELLRFHKRWEVS